MMKRRFVCLTLLTLLIGITFIHLSARAVMADKAAVVYYDSSKFEPISMIEYLPLFKVMDQRPAKRVFFEIKRQIIPPYKYFKDGLQDSITQSSSVIQDDGRELQFIIKDFRVVFTNRVRQMGGELRSTIEVDVLITENGQSIDIGNYKTVYWDNVGPELSYKRGIATQDIQSVIDRNFHKIIEKIFTDKSFIGILKKTS
jgi:hypothetical protein